MAGIIQDTKQIDALREINELLELTGRINSALEPEVTYSIVASATDSRSAIKIPVPEEKAEKIAALLSAERARISKAVNTKANKFKISLDEEDLAVLNGSTYKRHSGRPRKATQEEPGIGDASVNTSLYSSEAGEETEVTREASELA